MRPAAVIKELAELALIAASFVVFAVWLLWVGLAFAGALAWDLVRDWRESRP